MWDDRASWDYMQSPFLIIWYWASARRETILAYFKRCKHQPSQLNVKIAAKVLSNYYLYFQFSRLYVDRVAILSKPPVSPWRYRINISVPCKKTKTNKQTKQIRKKKLVLKIQRKYCQLKVRIMWDNRASWSHAVFIFNYLILSISAQE